MWCPPRRPPLPCHHPLQCGVSWEGGTTCGVPRIVPPFRIVPPTVVSPGRVGQHVSPASSPPSTSSPLQCGVSWESVVSPRVIPPSRRRPHIDTEIRSRYPGVVPPSLWCSPLCGVPAHRPPLRGTPHNVQKLDLDTLVLSPLSVVSPCLWCPLLSPLYVVSPVVPTVCDVPCCLPCVWSPLLSPLCVVSPCCLPSVYGVPCCPPCVWCPLLSPLCVVSLVVSPLYVVSPVVSPLCMVSPVVSPVCGVPCCLPSVCGVPCCPPSVWCPLLSPLCVVSPVVSPLCGVPCCPPSVWCPLLSPL